MADADFTVALKDKVTGPANRMGGAVGKLGAKVRGVGADAGVFGGGMAKAVAVGNIMAKTAIAAAKAVLRLGLALGRAVLGAAAFRENITFSLTKFLGDSGKAKRNLGEIAQISGDLGLNFQTSAEQFRDLVSAGFGTEASKELLRFKADLIAVGGGGAQAAERATSALDQFKKAMATGRFEADGFVRVLEQIPGVTKDMLLEKMADQTGKSLEKLKKTEITKLPVQELIDAFKEATLEATGMGKHGQLAAERIETTTSGAIDALKNKFTNLPDTIAAGLDEFEGLGDAVRELLAFMDSEDAADAMQMLADGVTMAVKAFVAAIPIAQKFLKGIQSGFQAASPAIDALSDAMSAMSEDGDSLEALGMIFEGLGHLIGFSLGAIVAAVQLVVLSFQMLIAVWDGLSAAATAVFDFFSSLVDTVSEAAGELGISADGVGSAIIDGLIAGIMGGAGAVTAALIGIAETAIAAGLDVLGVSSPSKVFEDIGYNTMEGFRLGIDRGGAAIPAGVAGQLDPAALTGAMRPANNVSVSAPVGGITVNAAEDPEATAAAVKSVMLNELGDAFEQMSLQVGAA
ncbi:MAG: tape measure protein [Alphaproteobacteria bacterium]